MTDIYLLKLTDIEIVRKDWDVLIKVVSSEKRQRLERINQFDDAARSFVAEILLRFLIRQRLGIHNDDIIFKAGRYGKPFLAGAYENVLYFNVSHSGSWVAVSIGNCENGVDVQEMRSILNVTDKDAFFEEWVLREAKQKCLGVGMLGKLTGEETLFCKSFCPDEQTKAAVCAVCDGFSEPQTVSLEELLDTGGIL